MSFDYDVKIHLIKNPKGKTVAFANLIIDQAVEINGFRIFDGQYGLFVQAPSTKSNKVDEETGKPVYFDDVRFLGERPEVDGKVRKHTDLQAEIYKLMIERYKEEVATTGSNSQADAADAQANAGNPTGSRPQAPGVNNPLW